MTETDATPPLLTLLEAHVRRDGAPSLLQGSLAVGVRRSGDDTVWWTFRAVKRTPPKTELTRGRLEGEFNGAVLMDERTAAGMAAGELVAAPWLHYTGDRKWIRSIFARYLQPQSPNAVRFGHLSGNREG
jgi:hypothetical protein